MKKIYLSKKLKLLVILIFTLTIMSNFAVLAYDVTGQFTGDTSSITEGTATVTTIISTALDIVRFVGAGIAMIILMYIGVKFIMAAPSERASIKQYSINYVIGAFILIGASGILTIIKTVSQNAIVAQ